jgi:glycosyltransferase involved in cell wall biosynthesis
MDLCAEMLLAGLQRQAGRVRAARVCPPFRRRLSGLPWAGRRRWAFNADRLMNRFWDYPRHLRRCAGRFDLFHICDHSYAQLAEVLPAGRTGVFCHDLDAFRCLLEPHREPRPRWFRLMMGKVLRGLQKAAVVFHTTAAVRDQIEQHGLVDPARLFHTPNGISPEFTPEPAEEETEPVPGLNGRPYILHVGSCIPRKRIDVLLEVFAGVRRHFPGLALVQGGGLWTDGQREQIGRLGVGGDVLQVRALERTALAALYRRAAVVLQPSEAEGFGLPVIEALACGSAVVASDIPVLREVGGPACTFCEVANVQEWAEAVGRLLTDPGAGPGKATRLAWAKRFSWEAQAQTMLDAYRRLI